MEKYGFMRDLTGLNKHMAVDESIVIIGISGIGKASNKRHNKSYIVRRRYGH
jgi:hypothetical protein